MKNKYKSKLEKNVANKLKEMGIKFKYEPFRIPYLIPLEKHHYTPDFVPDKSKIIIEAKGRLTIADRKKMLLLKEQHPDYRFCLLFERANKPLYKGSKTTYAEWAEKHGFEWSDFYKGGIPERWVLNDSKKRKA